MPVDKSLISSYAAAILSIICKKMPRLMDYITRQSTPPKEYNRLLGLPFTLLTTEQVKIALESDEGLLREALWVISEIQKTLNLAQQQLENIENQKLAVAQTITSMIELMTAPKADEEASTQPTEEVGEDS